MKNAPTLALLMMAGCSTSTSPANTDEGANRRAEDETESWITPPTNATKDSKDAGPKIGTLATTPPLAPASPSIAKGTTSPTPVGSATPSAVPVPRFELTSPTEPAHRVAKNLKMLWISLDGLKREDVEKFLRLTKNPHPKGFRYLLAQDRQWTKVRVTNPTITASSHVSTITCAPPGIHGIVANGQWNGEAMESGFDKPYAADNFVQALRRAGKRVGVLAYPSIDGRAPNRTADFALAYDNSPVAPQFVDLAEGTHSSFSVSSRVNVGTKFQATATWEASEGKARITLPEGGTFELARGAWQQVEFTEGGTTELVALRLFEKAGAPAPVLYVAPTTTNNAHPTDFRRRMDSHHIVFSAGKNYVIRDRFGDEGLLELMRDRLTFFGRAARTMLSEQKADAFFLYLEDLDTLGHQYAGDASADTLRAEHFARLDATLGSILELIPSTTNVLLVGDHGMSAINYELNAGALVPVDAKDKLLVKASGGSLFLYGRDKASLTGAAPVSQAWFQDTARHLRELRLPTDASKPLFAKVVVRGSTQAREERWQDGTALPWIAAFATPGVAFRESVETGLLLSVRKGVVLPESLLAQATGTALSKEPQPYGQHGHSNDSPEMLTNVVLLGPQFHGRAPTLGKRTTNLSLVPFAADALDWPRPAACPRVKK